YESALRDLAARLGVADRVAIRFVPPTDREAMARALAGAGVMTLLSDYEAHPVAAMEALAVGRPVVVSRTSGLTELAARGWAVALPASAPPAETAAAIERQLTSPVVPDSSELPTWDTCVGGVADTYEAILASPKRRLRPTPVGGAR